MLLNKTREFVAVLTYLPAPFYPCPLYWKETFDSLVSSRNNPSSAKKERIYSLLWNQPAKAAFGMIDFRGTGISTLGSRENILCSVI